MSDQHMGDDRPTPSAVSRTIHRLAVPIILAWLAIVVVVSVGIPPLEQVLKEHAVSLSPVEAPAFEALTRMGEDFEESNSGSLAMIVLEGQEPLGDEAHQYYDRMVRALEADPHVQHVRDFWGDPLTSAAAQSADGKATYVQLDLTGEPGSTAGDE